MSKLLAKNQDLFLVAGIVAILLILFAPLPAFLLDLLLIGNFSLALTILLLTLYVEKPVAFSTFPTLLLVATLYRLALNVAATRLILSDAHAGEVIDAIGSFAVQGSYVVGLVVFFILIVVQYVVVTSGAQRVSEVAARFVLDSMPGQQMSIDADLNMGLIDQAEAKRRRKDLEKEASFYGAMDGASKFVKGDAVAGVIILLINIIGGWIVGMAQMGMDWNASLQTFTLLTIGDGVATQVPALIIATATGIIVTRSSADRQLSTEIVAQLASIPRIPAIVLAALLLLLAMPGMPKWAILILGGIVGLAWWATRRAKGASGAAKAEDAAAESDARASAKAQGVAPIQVSLGRELSASWQPLMPVLNERIGALRTQQAEATGFAFPPLVFQDSTSLGPNEYEILLSGARHARGELFADSTLAISSNQISPSLPGRPARDPAFGLPAIWVEDRHRDLAEGAGLTLADPMTVLMTHLSEVLRAQGPLLLMRNEVVAMLEGVRSRQPGLIEELVPTIMTVSDVQRVLQSLLAEEVSIKNIDVIAESLVDSGRHVKDRADLTEIVRQRLGHSICHGLRGAHEQLAVLSLNPRVEAQIADNVRGRDPSSAFVLEPRFAQQLLKKLIEMAEAMIKERLAPVLLCGPEVRRHVRSFTRRSIPKLAIVSVNEVPPNVDLRSFGVVTLD
jgi:flagellar biosynthesis protein FlhA